MGTIRWPAYLLIASLSTMADAAEPPFKYDRQQVVELAVARIRAEAQRYPQSAIPGVDYDHPLVVAVRARHQRRFVFVSFTSTLANWGAYVVFEQCSASQNVLRSASGKVINIEMFRDLVSRIDSTTPIELRSVCPHQ